MTAEEFIMKVKEKGLGEEIGGIVALMSVKQAISLSVDIHNCKITLDKELLEEVKEGGMPPIDKVKMAATIQMAENALAPALRHHLFTFFGYKMIDDEIYISED